VQCDGTLSEENMRLILKGLPWVGDGKTRDICMPDIAIIVKGQVENGKEKFGGCIQVPSQLAKGLMSVYFDDSSCSAIMQCYPQIRLRIDAVIETIMHAWWIKSGFTLRPACLDHRIGES